MDEYSGEQWNYQCYNQYFVHRGQMIFLAKVDKENLDIYCWTVILHFQMPALQRDFTSDWKLYVRFY